MPKYASVNPRRKWNSRWLNGIVLLAFCVLVCATGGASRHDVVSLIVLRPLAVLALTYALIAGAAPLRGQPLPFWLLVGLAALTGMQLIPLPPTFWPSLPGRDAVAAVEAAVGMPSHWRPLSLTPARTWNTLFSLAIPLAAFCLYRIQDPSVKAKVPLAIVLCGAASMLWGLAQLVGGLDSPFYHYRIHTQDRPIGFFANRNHQAMFLALTILFAGNVVGTALQQATKRTPLVLTGLLGYVVLVLAFEFILGSRGGLLLAVLAVAIISIILTSSVKRRAGGVPLKTREGLPFAKIRRPWVILAAVGTVLLLLFLAASAMNRNEALARMFESGDTARYDRMSVLPFLSEMLADYFPWGSGFGSFDAVFRSYETTDLLSTFYLNQAHNDWMQFVIEGGLPAAVLLFALAAWWAGTLRQVWRQPGKLIILSALPLMAIGSVYDYPLRVPIIMVVVVLAICLAASGAEAVPDLPARPKSR